MTRATELDAAFFDRPVEAVARAMIGLAFKVEGVGGLIVETEAYGRDDPACHAFKGPTPRNAAMFGPHGRAYVYRSHGLHWCVNAVCRPGEAVLIRAIAPLWGVEAMIARRGLDDPRRLCAGPGRLCQALGIDGGHDGAPLDAPPFSLSLPAEAPGPIHAGPRIGIAKAVDTPWRFCLAGSPHLSRPVRTGKPAQRSGKV
jgi:DNA-3-methyladenine glycosylase